MLKLFVARVDSTYSIDGTYSVSGAASASGSYVLSSSYTEIWSKNFTVSSSSSTASLNLSFTIKATSPSAGTKTVYGSLSEVYLDYSSGGDSGGDDGGDSDDSGEGGGGSGAVNSGLKTYTVTAQGVTAQVTYTSGPEVTITITSWSGYNAIPYWRIKGVRSEGDDSIYLGQNNKASNSFDASGGYNNGGKNYIFQVCKNGNWDNDSGSASIFLVDFSLGGSGSGGEGGSTSPVTLYVNQGEGTKVKIIRTWSNHSSHYWATTGGIMYENGVMYDDQIWYDGDFFEIAVEVEDGYELDYYLLDGETVPFNTDNLEWFTAGEAISDKRYRLIYDFDVTITTTATPSATVRICNSSGWNKYILYIYNSSGWNKYTPYIYKDSSWNKYS